MKKNIIPCIITNFLALSLGGCTMQKNSMYQHALAEQGQDVKDFNVKKAQEFIHKNPEGINHQFEGGSTLMHLAVRGSNMELMQWLIDIDKKLDLNIKDDTGRTPLNWALALGGVQAISLLKAHDAHFSWDGLSNEQREAIINVLRKEISLGQIDTSGSLAEIIKQKIQEISPEVNIGIKITNLTKNKIIYEENADRYYKPASMLKLITVNSLLDHFSPNYKFIDAIYVKGNNYYLDINNPGFCTGDLEKLLTFLPAKTGLINNFYIIQKKFSTPSQIPSREIDDTSHEYGTPITKVQINKNCAKLMATSTEPGKKIKIDKQGIFPYEIINEAITISDSAGNQIYVNIQGNLCKITGTLDKQKDPVKLDAIANDNFAHVKYILKELLEKNNITLQADIDSLEESKTALGGAKMLASTEKSFTDIASVALKKSDNFFVDYLLAQYATDKGKSDWRHATNLVKGVVKDKFEVDLANTNIEDGSGLSRNNLVSINHMDRFLKSVEKQPDFTYRLSLMATPKEDSTLNGRFDKDAPVWAKTGTLFDTSTLAGYCYSKANEKHSFVITSNNIFGGLKKCRKVENDVINAVLQS